jgi:hypothetical protein
MWTRGSVSRRAVDWDGSLFLKSSMIRPTLLGQHERLAYVDYLRYIWQSAIHGLSAGCVWRVDQVSPVGLTSIQITVTLKYE